MSMVIFFIVQAFLFYQIWQVLRDCENYWTNESKPEWKRQLAQGVFPLCLLLWAVFTGWFMAKLWGVNL